VAGVTNDDLLFCLSAFVESKGYGPALWLITVVAIDKGLLLEEAGAAGSRHQFFRRVYALTGERKALSGIKMCNVRLWRTFVLLTDPTWTGRVAGQQKKIRGLFE